MKLLISRRQSKRAAEGKANAVQTRAAGNAHVRQEAKCTRCRHALLAKHMRCRRPCAHADQRRGATSWRCKLMEQLPPEVTSSSPGSLAHPLCPCVLGLAAHQLKGCTLQSRLSFTDSCMRSFSLSHQPMHESATSVEV